MNPRDDDIGSHPTERFSSRGSEAPATGPRAERAPAADPMVGRTVGTIRLTGVLGGGGMGAVYRGVDEKLGRDVAVKAIRSQQMTDGEARGRFLREAQVLSRLNHPNICQVYDHIEGDDNHYLVLELVEGESLGTAIRSGIPRPRALAIAEQLAAVLTVTHARGIVHRDLKPDNVMLTAGGEVKVLDFGLAREERGGEAGRRPVAAPGHGDIDRSAVSSTVETVLGTVVGTIGYMSPEQARGEPASPPSDIYSLGLLLQELFTGRVPFSRTSTAQELLIAAALGESSPTEGLPADLTRLIVAMKSPDPDARPTAPAVADRLRRIIDAPRRRLRWAAAVVAIVAVVGGSVKYTWDLSRERTAALEARTEAVAAREDAEEVMTFILEDLYNGLVPLGRLDLLEQVSQQALDYYGPERAGGSLTDEGRRRQSRALRNIGRVFEYQGDLDKATAAYETSRRLSGSLVVLDPADSESRAGLAMAYLGLGQVKTMQGEFDESLASYENAIEHLRLSLEADPEHAEWTRYLANSHVQLGNLLFMAGDLERAHDELQEAIAVTEKRVKNSPDDLTIQADLGDRYRLLSQVLAALGDATAAREASDMDIDLCLNLARKDEMNASNFQGLLEGYTWRGRLLMEEGDLSEAVGDLRSAVRFGERLIADDPTNTHWQFRLSASYDTLGEALMASGRRGDALDAFDRALALMLPIAGLDPSNAYYRNDLAYSYLQVGKTRAALGQTGAAREAWAEAVRVVAPIAGEDALPTIQETYAQALLLLGRSDEAHPVVRRVLDAGWPLDPTTERLCREQGLPVE